MIRRKLGVQLYSMREMADRDTVGTLKKLADAGFDAVEPASFHQLTPREFKAAADACGLEILTSFAPFFSCDQVAECCEVAEILQMNHFLIGYGPEHFESRDTIHRLAEVVNNNLACAAQHRLHLVLHNHYWEFEILDGQFKLDWLLAECPDLRLELDTYWCANFGSENSAAMVRRYAEKIDFLHIKDGSLIRDDWNFVAAGSGKIDIPAVVAAAPSHVKMFVLEMDHCQTDMLSALTAGCHYMRENHLV